MFGFFRRQVLLPPLLPSGQVFGREGRGGGRVFCSCIIPLRGKLFLRTLRSSLSLFPETRDGLHGYSEARLKRVFSGKGIQGDTRITKITIDRYFYLPIHFYYSLLPNFFPTGEL